MAIEDADLDALTDEITTLCGHLDAAEYRLLELIRRLDESAPWGLWDVKSCAHWLNWKCGIALGAAREKVRVAHALTDLPLISNAFRSGRLSYSKVRAITRIANAENEALMVEMGLSATAAQIEKIVRKYRQVERLQASNAAMALHERRSLTVYWAEDGALVLNGRLTPEQGAVLVEALAAVEVETPLDEPRAATPAWYGERVDYDHVLWVMDQGADSVSGSSPTTPTANRSLRPVPVRDASARARSD